MSMDEIIKGETVVELVRGLVASGYLPSTLRHELRTTDDWKSAQFRLRGHDGIVGIVTKDFTSLDEVRKQCDDARTWLAERPAVG